MSDETKKLKYQPTKADSEIPLNPPTAGSAEISPTHELTSEQIMADPRVMALVEALEYANALQKDAMKVAVQLPIHSVSKYDLYLSIDLYELKADAALAALTDNEGETE